MKTSLAVLCCLVLVLTGSTLGNARTCKGATCPDSFIYDESVDGCYKLVTENVPSATADTYCSTFDKRAHPLIVNSAAEQTYIVNFIVNSKSLMANCYKYPYSTSRGYLVLGYNVKTAGHPISTSPLVYAWNVTLADGRGYSIQYMQYSNWYPGEPNLATEKCVYLFEALNNYTWGNENCFDTCMICEIDMY